MPHLRPTHPAPWRRRIAGASLCLGLLGMSAPASAAPWRSHVTLPSGDEVQLRTGGLRVQPSGSRGEIDLPMQVRFAKPVDSPAGSVDMADAKVRILCKEGTVSATRAPLLQALSAPAVIDSLCKP